MLHIAVFSGLGLALGLLVPQRWRTRLLLVSSVAAIYWLQPSTPIRNLDFWLPTAAVLLTLLVWAIVQPTEGQVGLLGRLGTRFGLSARSLTLSASAVDLGLILAVILLIALTRYFPAVCCLTPTRPPVIGQVLPALALGVLLAVFPVVLPGTLSARRALPGVAIAGILALFVILKSDLLAEYTSGWLRRLTGQPAELASVFDLTWLGFSYMAFRLLHVLRDNQTGRLADRQVASFSLGEFIVYVLFFPAYTAGPIDRVQRFVADLRQPQPQTAGALPVDTPAADRPALQANPDSLVWGSRRILVGVFKKFVIADSLALIALNSQNADQTISTAWLWVLLYAYSLQIYFDFSGYTDIALGLARLVGIALPENFERPYLKTNLTAFWNSWHITLAQWFRAYFFYPVTRALRARPERLPAWAVILMGQVGTMALIGLWHGISWTFLVWGLWHGVGLFLNNRWTDWYRQRSHQRETGPAWERISRIGSWALTFNFVTLGWAWFALPDIDQAWTVFRHLLGVW